MNETVSQIRIIQNEISSFLDMIAATGKEQFMAIKTDQTEKIEELLERKQEYIVRIEELKNYLGQKMSVLKKNSVVDINEKHLCDVMFDKIQKKIQDIIRHEHRDLHSVIDQKESVEQSLKDLPAGKRVLHTYQQNSVSVNPEKQWEG
ncbi:MAG: hypothetical protein RBU23_10305 [Candidatus Auribacterota bacterium]|nr:hypothetical protein [Candidatus Auribacterota bacterium]